MQIDGACHCGAIGFEADVDPRTVVISHCSDCQTISGAPYRVNVRARTSQVRLSGDPQIYEKVGGSGHPVITAFCGTCGSALYSASGRSPEFMFLRLGVIRQRASLAPVMQGFCEFALPWATDISGVRLVGR